MSLTDLSAEELSFVTAREAVRRGCIERYRKEHPELPPDTFHTLPLLLAPELRSLAWTALGQARGKAVTGDALFTATIWIEYFDKQKQALLKGAQATMGGIAFRRPLTDFIKLLHERAAQTAPKRQGWVIEPTSNLDGHRTNASTTAMHSLFLDCDGCGEWDLLIAVLTQLDFCFIAYQSGGWSSTTPKWRVVLPLSTPFPTVTEAMREAWKAAYHQARVVFGSLAYLYGQGFDPATDTPCCPWFLTEKRDEKDPLRQVIWRIGHTLDLMSLILALPATETDDDAAGMTRSRAESLGGLSDERLDEIILALAAVTNHVPSGRHDLYLALPGVMLDRGVMVDDVLAIIEGVSASYPRKHADKHRDNIHNAKTTISRWQSGHNVTRIGTVQERWPEIAQVLDKVVPDPAAAMLAASTAAMLNEVSTPTVARADNAPVVEQGPKKRKKRLSTLGREIAPLVTRMGKSTKTEHKIAAVLLRRIIDGEPFIADTAEQIDSCVSAAMVALGFNLPTATWVQILDLAHLTLLSMDFTQSAERVAVAEQAFLKGQQDRRKWNRKKHNKVQEKLEAAQDYFAEAALLRDRK
jgi:hypothetical protein